ncbi:hypothetical protein [Vulcaniibacterium tengchongense]|uniref:Uncharacterized protein n=1 Tax=Vulcaniibacterium tengchongense TaxID=1273429 RepID=A0A3N4VRH2_9GAMM|nr:hypothetical protein [Vulcaniibacterium tengchongense]RPE81811.1 hypothetical protein EDC50_1013 [Vulcaniibacterium tengchongense]
MNKELRDEIASIARRHSQQVPASPQVWQSPQQGSVAINGNGNTVYMPTGGSGKPFLNFGRLFGFFLLATFVPYWLANLVPAWERMDAAAPHLVRVFHVLRSFSPEHMLASMLGAMLLAVLLAGATRLWLSQRAR